MIISASFTDEELILTEDKYLVLIHLTLLRTTLHYLIYILFYSLEDKWIHFHVNLQTIETMLCYRPFIHQIVLHSYHELGIVLDTGDETWSLTAWSFYSSLETWPLQIITKISILLQMWEIQDPSVCSAWQLVRLEGVRYHLWGTGIAEESLSAIFMPLWLSLWNGIK